MREQWFFWLIIGLAGSGLVMAIWFFLSSDARLRRRRRKSHTRLTSKAKGPSVKFSVRPPKE